MRTVGIIGFGSFGAFTAKALHGHVAVRVSSRDPQRVPEQWRATFAETAACDYVIPTIPLESYEAILVAAQPFLKKDSVIVDVCSVKLKPLEIIKRILPEQRIVATHPLFGPESAASELNNHTLVVCPESSDRRALAVLTAFAGDLGLRVVEKSADEHDREMATVHALTFFVAQGLIDSDIHDASLHTPSFKKLLSLAELERHHSAELFRTLQTGNPYAAATRQRFLDALHAIDQSLDVEP